MSRSPAEFDIIER